MSDIFDIDLKPKSSKEGNFSNYQKIQYAGGSKQAWPMRARILVNVHHPEEAKTYHDFTVHMKKVNGQFININCPRNVQGRKCAICSRFYELRALEKEVKSKNGSLTKEQTNELLNARPKTSTFVLVNEVGSPEIKLFNIGSGLKDGIFGNGELSGALEVFDNMGLKVFNPKETRGWIEIKKSGSGTDTKYQVSPWSSFDKSTGSSSLVSQAVLPEVTKKLLDKDSLYRIRENFMKDVWTEEEAAKHVESGYTWYPEKFAKRYKLDLSLKAVGDAPVVKEAAQNNNVSLDDVFNSVPQAPKAPPKAPEAPKKAVVDSLDDIPF